MTTDQIQENVKAQLKSFNHNGLEITDDTVVGEVFDNPNEFSKKNEGFFKGVILWTLNHSGHKPSSGNGNKFPASWKSMTVAGLARALFIFVFIMVSFGSMAQLKLNIGAINTEAKKNAINFAFSYVKSLDSAFGGSDLFVMSGSHAYFMVTPDFEFQTGNQDAFSSLIGRVQGNFVSFKTKIIDGITAPDADRLMNVFPVSAGVETNNQFSFLNALVEGGYEPYYQSPLAKVPDWVRHTMFGVYIQAGHKFSTGKDTVLTGGAQDQSQEAVGSTLFRIKGKLLVDTKQILAVQGFRVGLTGGATAWLDLVNKAVYYRLEGVVRVFLTTGTSFDLNYTKGSGAPNFNQGDQFGAGLTLTF